MQLGRRDLLCMKMTFFGGEEGGQVHKYLGHVWVVTGQYFHSASRLEGLIKLINQMN